MRAPDFWRDDNGIARLLEPFGLIYGAVTARRMTRAKPYKASQPVICVGNLTVGGSGKTPVAASIAARLSDQGRSPAILIHGYGGSMAGPVRVSGNTHTVEEVGDEALLHARYLPTWVARQRSAAAPLAIAGGADVLIMDDGHQHPSLAKDLSLVVVSGFAGFGNGRIVPAGPLREPIVGGLARADAVVMMGDDQHSLAPRLAQKLPVLRANLALGPEWQALRGQRVVAFAGIGGPERFLNTLQAVGAQVVAFHPFGDHYGYAPADIQPMLDEAYGVNALAVTTDKDAVRLDPDQRQQVNVLTVKAEWEDESALDRLLDKALVRG
jgi:tetraacyldisaccharide 4'-kinase